MGQLGAEMGLFRVEMGQLGADVGKFRAETGQFELEWVNLGEDGPIQG